MKKTINTAKKEVAGLIAAEAEFEAACAKLRKRLRRAYPIGMKLAVMMGGHRIVGRVTGVSSDWSLHSLQDVTIENVRTMKMRRFNGLCHSIYKPEVLELP